MKTLILENDWERDIPSVVKKVLEYQFLDSEKELWERFQVAYWSENREETIKRFTSLNSGDNLICGTVFLDYQQVEIMIKILSLLKEKGIKLNFYIFAQDTVRKSLAHFIFRPIVYVEDKKPHKKYVEQMKEVLDYHNIYELLYESKYECRGTFEEFLNNGCIHITNELLYNKFIFKKGEKVKIENDETIYIVDHQGEDYVKLEGVKFKYYQPTDLIKVNQNG